MVDENTKVMEGLGESLSSDGEGRTFIFPVRLRHLLYGFLQRWNVEIANGKIEIGVCCVT